VFVALLVWRWPLLKGWVYRASDRPAPAASFEWRTDLDAALAEARHLGRPVFADFQADWCPPCIAMAHDVWPDPEVGRLLTERYVPLSIDVDRDPDAAARYRIHGIPTILVLDGDGRVLRRASFMSRGGILDFLRRADTGAD
jgi:thiol:disulfide interchange protein